MTRLCMWDENCRQEHKQLEALPQRGPRDLGEQRNNAMKFWGQRLTRYSKLNEFAQHFLSAPASQAYMYMERIFSLYGFLTTGRRNLMKQSLEMRAFLRLNSFL